jgi:hypothetical protein
MQKAARREPWNGDCVAGGLLYAGSPRLAVFQEWDAD